MRTVKGAGCWGGRAEGPVIWQSGERVWERTAVADRAAEILRFRAEWSRAYQDLETWSEQQSTVAARLLLQGYKEALSEDSWSRRICGLIDAEGICASVAAVEAARQVSTVLSRSETLRERAALIVETARWLAGRLAPLSFAADAIIAAADLTAVELLELGRPALIAGPEPPVSGNTPLVWGVPNLGPDWHRRRVAIDGALIELDVPDPRWWPLHEDRMKGIPVCYLSGDLEALTRMAARLGQPPVAIVHRLDDLAAAPVFAAQTAAIAVDLDQFGPARRLRHPGFELLIRAAAAAAHVAGVPLLAGGQYAHQSPDRWANLGFTGFFGAALPQRGLETDAVRRRTQGSQ